MRKSYKNKQKTPFLMKKARFTYTKDDNTKSTREILSPNFVKEATNKIKDFEKPEVKYLEGYQIDKNGLSEEEQKKYEEVLDDYVDWEKPTIEEFFSQEGLDSKRIQWRNFKKSGISELKVLED